MYCFVMGQCLEGQSENYRHSFCWPKSDDYREAIVLLVFDPVIFHALYLIELKFNQERRCRPFFFHFKLQRCHFHCPQRVQHLIINAEKLWQPVVFHEDCTNAQDHG